MKIIGEVEKTLKALNYAILNGINKKRLPLKATFLRSESNPSRVIGMTGTYSTSSVSTR
jgi:UDP-N-acetylmuramyl tripeptide synthase